MTILFIYFFTTYSVRVVGVIDLPQPRHLQLNPRLHHDPRRVGMDWPLGYPAPLHPSRLDQVLDKVAEGDAETGNLSGTPEGTHHLLLYRVFHSL